MIDLCLHAEIKFGNMASLGVTGDSLPLATVFISTICSPWRKLIIAINKALFERQVASSACLSLSMHPMLALTFPWLTSAPGMNPSEKGGFATLHVAVAGAKASQI